MPLPSSTPNLEPFNDPAWIWALKLGWFRSLVHIEKGECRLVSRTGHVYKSFDPLRASQLRELKVKEAILDGEALWLDAEGRSILNPLLFTRRLTTHRASIQPSWHGYTWSMSVSWRESKCGYAQGCPLLSCWPLLPQPLKALSP